MRREVRRSRFQVGDLEDGEPRPQSLRGDSEVLAAIPHLSGEDLRFLFMDREGSTLSKHLSSWTRWLEFCRSIDVQAGKPSPAAVLDFARALSFGAASDRGRQRIARAKEIIGSLKFVANKLGLWLGTQGSQKQYRWVGFSL